MIEKKKKKPGKKVIFAVETTARAVGEKENKVNERKVKNG